MAPRSPDLQDTEARLQRRKERLQTLENNCRVALAEDCQPRAQHNVVSVYKRNYRFESLGKATAMGDHPVGRLDYLACQNASNPRRPRNSRQH